MQFRSELSEPVNVPGSGLDKNEGLRAPRNPDGNRGFNDTNQAHSDEVIARAQRELVHVQPVGGYAPHLDERLGDVQHVRGTSHVEEALRAHLGTRDDRGMVSNVLVQREQPWVGAVVGGDG